MALTQQQIESIAHLARLKLNENEIPAYRQSLSSILEFVSQLSAVATQEVAPMAHPLPGLTQRMRPDEVKEEDRRERYQANAPQVQAGLYLVPKVIE